MKQGHIALGLHIEFGFGDDKLSLQEFKALASSAGVHLSVVIQARLYRNRPGYFIGRGKIDELRAALVEQDLRFLLVNHDLEPAQERNLERLCQARVLDRSGLILDIFSQRASSSEGKLQVELAQLEFLSTRLVRGWSHLERQKGGIGLRGPGEKQLETDRRLISRRIARINRRLAKIKAHRALSRALRKDRNFLSVALVGYSNAGKSSLFNALTTSKAETADRLFTTLDSVTQKVNLGGGKMILIDTVGFIRGLPQALIEAFNATLLEVREADMLLHITDICAPEYDANKHKVDSVLREIGADNLPRVIVNNKIDLAGEDVAEKREPRIDRNAEGSASAVSVSAKSGAGIDLLKTVLTEFLSAGMSCYRVKIPRARESLRSQIYTEGIVHSEKYVPEIGWWMIAALQKRSAMRFRRKGLKMAKM